MRLDVHWAHVSHPRWKYSCMRALLGSCLLKCISVSQSRDDCSLLNTEKKEVNKSWPKLCATGNKFQIRISCGPELASIFACKNHMHARIICTHGISAPYLERHLNVHCRNIKKFQVILLEFSIPNTAYSQHIILSL